VIAAGGAAPDRSNARIELVDEDAKKWLYWAIPIVVVVGIGVALYYGRRQKEAEAPPAAQTQPAPSTEQTPQHPIGEEPQDVKPLPPLAESDPAVQESITSTLGRSIEQFLVPDDIVRHFVATVDNLPRKETAVKLWPVKPTAGELATSGTTEPMLSEQNAERYAPIMKIVQNANMAQLAAMYRRFYPLFQEAYVDLGYPDGYFNDRLVEVIDHLLATPDVRGPIKLTQPSVFYEFADPTLEERSAGQKLLIRMGGAHAETVKAKLRELRNEITKQGPTR
jgi:hypothetical protein